MSAATAAGDCGSISVWKDDDGMWRCEFQRHYVTLDTRTFKHLSAACQWMKEWFPIMRGEETQK